MFLHAQGSAHLYGQLQADLAMHMQNFERLAMRTSLNIPAGLLLPTSAPAAAATMYTAEDEQRVDEQLARLRADIQEVSQDSSHKLLSDSRL